MTSPSLSSAAAVQQRIAALAGDSAVHRAFAWLHLHEPQLRRWQHEFLPIEAPPFGERERAQWFLERFAELGLRNCHIDSEGNVLGEHRVENVTEASSPMVLLSAHLDTVFPRGTPCTPRDEGARIKGPGACDNGAGLAALLGLAAAIRSAGLRTPATLLFAANVGEEGEGDLRGMRHLFSCSPYAPRLRAAIALEGAGTGTVVDRALGGRRLRVTIHGPGGHSWADAGLPNPILALAHCLLELASIPLPDAPRTTLNCGTVRGGTSVNSIPASASADLDLRSVSAAELDKLDQSVLTGFTAGLQRFRSLHEKILASPDKLQPPLQLQVERTGNRPAATLPAHSTLLSSLRAVDRHLQIQTDPRVGSTDANFPLSLGIPALAIGAGGTGGGVHTLGEWYDPSGRELALRRILLLLLDTAATVAHAKLVPDPE